eukprot:CAMPEP_0169462408 /NCGR_PEP_ID=MMETSP1042-20121227/19551_1 /TAXON_ID=464988 /ORGANISM="Hemiselmis andersenii, Strain CCMP1180" /LENGTH=292 /DNA_ID=CAMNT_0009575057 /DNA_START=162 /DNA_END=1036 /DNA_ORIENTATION=+
MEGGNDTGEAARMHPADPAKAHPGQVGKGRDDLGHPPHAAETEVGASSQATLGGKPPSKDPKVASNPSTPCKRPESPGVFGLLTALIKGGGGSGAGTPAPPSPAAVGEDVSAHERFLVERQRRLTPFSDFRTTSLLPTDPKPLSWARNSMAGQGKQEPHTESVAHIVPEEWELVPIDGDKNHDGWRYAFNWNFKFDKTCRNHDFVRVRHWRRSGGDHATLERELSQAVEAADLAEDDVDSEELEDLDGSPAAAAARGFATPKKDAAKGEVGGGSPNASGMTGTPSPARPSRG